MKIASLYFAIIFLISTNSLAINGVCTGIGLDKLNSGLMGLVLSANQVECMNTRQNYQCEKVEEDLDPSEKNKVIQCDQKSLSSNNISDMSLVSCVWNGFKMSGENLVDLAKLPGAIAEAAMKGFRESQECNKSLDKKRQLLNAFNSSVTDSRFKLTESFLGRSFPDMSCSEIEKLVHARYDNYLQQVDREMRAAKLTNKNYKMPEELMAKNSDLLKTLDQVFKQAGVTYNCYTPKAKAEMICAGVTSLLADVALGVGVTKAITAVKSFAKSKRALSSIERAVASGEKANLADSGLLRLTDRIKAAEAVIGRKLSKEEAEALKAAHEIGLKEGRGYFTYTQEDIEKKARLLKEAGFNASERRSLMENGIAGAQSSVKPANVALWHEQRLKGEKLVSEFSQTGNREKMKQGLEEARKFYKQFLDNGDTKILFTGDQGGFANLVRANEYGLTAKESAKVFERSFGGTAKEAAANYKNAIGSLNNQIREYEAMIKAGKAGNISEGLQYKIYKAKELRGQLVETYYERKYPDKFKELDWDLMNRREQDLLSSYREDLQTARAKAEKAKLPLDSN